MDGSAPDSVGTSASWLRCYRCWSQNLEVQVHYEGVLKVGPEAGDSLAFGAFGDHGTREFFTHVRFHKHDGDQIVVHMLVELYARSMAEATEVLEAAARGPLTITSLAEESRPPAAALGPDDQH